MNLVANPFTECCDPNSLILVTALDELRTPTWHLTLPLGKLILTCCQLPLPCGSRFVS